MDNKLVFKQKNSISFSTKVVPSMKILEMGAFELKDYLNKVLDNNPVFEIEEVNDNYKKSEQTIDINNISNREENSLYDYVYYQIVNVLQNKKEEEIASYILCSLDNNGYFKENIDDSSSFLKVSVKEFKKVLDLIKTCEPLGVAASDLKECLLIQMKNSENHIAKEIVEKYLDYVAKGNYKFIASKLNINYDEIVDAIEMIKSLNPRPANGFSNSEKTIYIIPDVFIEKEDDRLIVKINNSYIPSFKKVESYQTLYKNSNDQETKNFLKNKYKEFRNLNFYLAHRNVTLENVIMVIIDVQKEYFLSKDKKKIAPLKLQDISSKLNISCSTVSRAIKNKYYSYDGEILPLSYFLNKEICKGISKYYLLYRLEELIQSEDKNKTMSDEQLLMKLKKEGINVSRRTINNYRNEILMKNSKIRKMNGNREGS